MSNHKFQTEVNQLLHLIIHSLYSHKEIFLRELISNSSDAMDKLRYLTLTDEKYKSINQQPRVDISFEEKSNVKTLIISDNGIGMNEQDLIENLGTIASSGTKKFVSQLTGDEKKDANLIGQFGVGFYSCFMVADKAEVISKKAGEDKAFKWTSNGKDGYDLEETERESFGTTIILHLNEEGVEYANRWQIQNIIKKYSNHIAFPIYLSYIDTKYEGEGDDKKPVVEMKTEQINSASALWKRPKSELKDEDYNEFYKSISHDYDDPMITIHTRAEGTLDYTTLFFVPKKAPVDLFRADYKAGVKLYVKRVFITDDEKELMPTYLRFVKGIIDSEDLPLNVSREILQQNKTLAKIKSNSVKKILTELLEYAKDNDKYKEFYDEYGRPMKEGLYQDFENRETLMELVRFKSTKMEGYTSFGEYQSRMKPEQKSIYYITGTNEKVLRNSPLLELYKEKDIEVLILDDEIDEIVIPSLNKYREVELKSVNRSDAAEDLKTGEDKKDEDEIKSLVDRVKKVLGEKVKEVKASTRLSGSPCCIVADQNDPTVQMQSILKAMGQNAPDTIKPILEINPNNSIIKKMNAMQDNLEFENACNLLLDQALLIEGAKIENPTDFINRLNSFMDKAL